MDALIRTLQDELNKTIVGQADLVKNLLISLIADGHVLLEGPPGIAKTTAAKALANSIDSQFHRIQFTPDLLPGDVTGSDIYQQATGEFEFVSGPIMNNIILADEINRAPAKVQSALLEAMGERQVTVGNKSYSLPELFFVIATQNPIEQEGTYPLPEAQLDRFMMKIKVDYPSAKEELEILRRVRSIQSIEKNALASVCSIENILKMRTAALNLYMAETVEEYIVQLIMATRHSEHYLQTNKQKESASLIEFGSSPRGTLALDRCARAHALLKGKDYVTPDDVKAVAHSVLRHRILPSFEAEAQGFTTDIILNTLLERVPVI
ncbi:AAA family ATPase [Marinomonas sp. 2405UD68-3]|uniref:AAA family ATPase n=1 Tax=Marinomonas sp. 2405UD68-3 TaxID=3391835 RepID=UPI0039C96F5C